MNWKQLAVGPVQANAAIIWNNEKEALIVDPGAEGSKIYNEVDHLGLKPVAILLTHAHFDHIGAVDFIRDHYRIPVYLHKKEADWMQNPALNGSSLFPMVEDIEAKPADELIEQERKLAIGSFNIDVYETPGHSPGSVSFYFEDLGVVFSGDALFQGSIGRTDLPLGNHDQLINSIHNRLLTLPEHTIVASGHGPATTIEQEMTSNPFLNGFSI
ncbi:MBL fold metallo-hydrolase [Guptibacillus algicola]|uniref:MBL fold metallo-hydrolase n=1 Tax=Guptibacillus algicola TaxID=225844 RepID=UPI001CD1CFDB|nr:MBL fold metallo-hydrolase [Alkalihalobacillus algicola]MCA0986015.1 MBL fold metallo-hydrolase [Alkalihalobacillus algicola]